ncbi:MAG: amidohydrolase [Anaerolineae bacterium]|nr:amidohydrolase [Anaerolineae bacterium]
MREIERAVKAVENRVVAYRRDFHRHAESGWTEFRTASLVARRLAELGWEVSAGSVVVDSDARMGLPPGEDLEAHRERARVQGGDAEYLEAMRGGLTGVVGVLRAGDERTLGLRPTVAIRFDMDALDLVESKSEAHRPAREGFRSVNEGACHACGHDGHTAIGLGLAEVLSNLRGRLHGTIKLIFQPAEEGVRGAKAMVAAGVVDDVDYLLGLHLYSGWEVGQVEPGRSGFLATSKFDALITGAPAHAGGAPNEGKNALLAAATAVLNLHAIPRHRDGATRINVGRLVAGTGRNVVPGHARLVIETRGQTTALNEYMVTQAEQVLRAAAEMHGCTIEIWQMGGAQSGDSDQALAERVAAVARRIDSLSVRAPEESGGSEDYTYMMTRVQERGGQATNIGLGADLGGWGHHTAEFDIDERALRLAVVLLAGTVADLMAR